MENKEKSYLIVISLLLFIIGIGAGYIVGVNQKAKIVDKEKIEQKENNEKDHNSEKRKKDKEVGNKNGTLKSHGTEEKVEITLNNTTKTLALLDGYEIEKKSYMTFGDTNIDKLVHYGTAGVEGSFTMPSVNYRVINGKDNKEYLAVYYSEGFQHILLILNDEAKIIGEYSNKITTNVADCFASFNKEYEPLFKVKGNELFYYKYTKDESSSKSVSFDNNGIELEQYKIELNNNKVIETQTGNKSSGKFCQCT